LLVRLGIQIGQQQRQPRFENWSSAQVAKGGTAREAWRWCTWRRCRGSGTNSSTE
jgi:hypothetical protein